MNRQEYDQNRSWIEIDLKALQYNVNSLMKLLDYKEQFMAVVKADAYGHGAVRISQALNQWGIKAFAVATLAEAIELRHHEIKGDILILGYTDPCQAYLLKDYQLIQTIIDDQYAKNLNQQKVDVNVHVAIDTGMHRIGYNSNDLQGIKDIYALKYLHVKGIFSHLCVCDSQKKEDIDYTYQQISTFNKMIQALKDENYPIGKIHIQSSYGLMNYSHIKYDYARIGIALYGVHSSLQEKQQMTISLKPVLSLKSKIIMIKRVPPDATIGYGRTYKTFGETIIAIVPIGYADGLPRNLSNCGQVLVNGKKVNIVGRICMDQMMIDVSDIQNIKVNDLVTIIGSCENESITAEELANQSGTITNEILSRLGHRLPKIYKGAES